MKNKQSCRAEYVLAKNVRSNGNSIIHNWISMLLAGICRTTAGVAVLWVNDYGVAYEKIGRLELL